MSEETKEELKNRLYVADITKEERKISDERYAAKIVERVVFGIIAVAAASLIGLAIQAIFANTTSSPPVAHSALPSQ